MTKNRYLIQKHDASRLHYDVRLQVDDKLVSWAVPKGPSTDPRDKRLAQRTADHELQYKDFEGIIASGYGAGTVMLWDRGHYRNLRDDATMAESLADGKVEVWLEGDKLQGGYVFIKTSKDEQSWLMKKIIDEAADARRNPVSSQPDSVKTGRSLDEIRAAEEDD